MSKKFKSSSEEIWAMTKEFRKDLKETSKEFRNNLDKMSKEFRRDLKEKSKEFRNNLDKMSKEAEIREKKLDKKFAQMAVQQAENKELIKEIGVRQAKTDEQMKKTDEQIRKTDKRLDKYFGQFGNDWGVFGENLVKGNLAKRLSERGITVDKVFTNLKNEFAEFDIVAINGKELVVVEVKSKLGVNDVDKFLSQMKTFKKYWPRLTKRKKLYGAMAFLVQGHPEAIDKAKKAGFFIISATGDVIIKNKKGFRPTAFVN